MGNLSKIVRGASPRPIKDPKWFEKKSDVGWLRISDVTEQNGRIRHLEQHISKLGQEKTRVISTSHLLLSIAATVGKPVINYVKTGVHDGFLIFVDPKFDLEFMYQWLEMFRPRWNKYGQPGSQVNLNSELVRNQRIYIPVNKEQKRIAELLKQCDKVITLHQQRLDQLNTLKKALLQKMFADKKHHQPELRFKEFSGDWKQEELGEVVERITRKNKNLESTLPLTISAQYGLVDQRTFFDKVVASRNVSNYYLIKQGEFAYNKSYSKGYPWGTIKRLDRYPEGVLSTLYILFKPTRINSDYLSHYYESSKWYREVSRNAAEGARNHGLLNISTSDFFNTRLMYPSNQSEQTNISKLFNILTDTITLHQRKLDQLQTLKKHLLQNMFI